MNPKSITQSDNPVLAGSYAALRRSAKRAKKIAEQTGTRLIVVPREPRSRVTKTDKAAER